MNLVKVSCFKYLNTNVLKIVGSSCLPSLLLLMTLLNSSSLFREHFLILVQRPWLLPNLNGEFCHLCQGRKSCLCDMKNHMQKASRRHFCLKAACWHYGEVHLQVGNPYCSQYPPNIAPNILLLLSGEALEEGKAGSLLLWPQICIFLV